MNIRFDVCGMMQRFNDTLAIPKPCIINSPRELHLEKNLATGFITINDQRSLMQKVVDVVKAIFNQLQVMFVKLNRRLSACRQRFVEPKLNESGKYVYAQEDLPWNKSTNSKGLYLLIHGLRGSPSDWKSYIQEIWKKNPKAHVLAPKVPLAGNCALNTAADPLIEIVNSYLKKFPGQPVTLIGTSNGGRIATHLETLLEPKLLGKSPLSIVSLAGVHYGTKMVDLLKKIYLIRLLRLDKELTEEFCYASDAARENHSSWRRKQAVWHETQQNVRHFFCATTEDEQVRDLSSSLPYHEASTSTYHITSGHTHCSMVDGVRAQVMQFLQE